MFGLARQVFWQDLYRRIGCKTNLGAEKYFQLILSSLQQQNPLHYLRFSQLRAGDFDGQFKTFAFSPGGHLQNFVRAFLFRSQQIQRVAHFAEFEKGHRGAHDDAISHFFQRNFLRSGLLLQLFGLAA